MCEFTIWEKRGVMKELITYFSARDYSPTTNSISNILKGFLVRWSNGRTEELSKQTQRASRCVIFSSKLNSTSRDLVFGFLAILERKQRQGNSPPILIIQNTHENGKFQLKNYLDKYVLPKYRSLWLGNLMMKNTCINIMFCYRMKRNKDFSMTMD